MPVALGSKDLISVELKWVGTLFFPSSIDSEGAVTMEDALSQGVGRDFPSKTPGSSGSLVWSIYSLVISHIFLLYVHPFPPFVSRGVGSAAVYCFWGNVALLANTNPCKVTQ